ncbi:DUF4112 domain-containing protein [Sphingomonas sp. LY54]|uniref:DUF4112 domain-containing protein n=1 Tax=Sphingomonadales TaxID=204457 RepID=UPI002ADEDD43|nr:MULTISPECIES: DUF4112 domain-containing protein [Sphingomonadales]MEA1014673.1 DUF4112 domain-containing protein [Sphingosinicella sp. LY1275]WRP29380.1 DUF4112 domain-containing protein [Sphingomonas sp. LY54]
MPTPQEQFEALAGQLPIGRDPASVRRRLEAVEAVLERAFVVPGINRPIGLDAILGLVPVLGDVITAAMGAWLVWEGRNLGMSKFHIARMAGNVGVDTALGAIPFVGDLFDFVYRSNTRNLRIIKRWLDKHHPETMLVEGEIVRR